MGEFDWNGNDDDAMGSFGTGEPRRQTAEQVIADLQREPDSEEVEEEEVMDEVQQRLEMANYYKMFLNGQIFENADDDAVAAAVEKEFRAFAKERLEILLGMRQPQQPVVKSPFTAEETAALKALASKVIGTKPALATKPEPPKPLLPAIRPMQAPKQEVQPKAVIEPIVIKKRGRPKGSKDKTPRKRAEVPQPQAAPPPQPPSRPPPGPKTVKPPGQVRPKTAKPMPFPSEQQAIAIESARQVKEMIETGQGPGTIGSF